MTCHPNASGTDCVNTHQTPGAIPESATIAAAGGIGIWRLSFPSNQRRVDKAETWVLQAIWNVCKVGQKSVQHPTARVEKPLNHTG